MAGSHETHPETCPVLRLGLLSVGVWRYLQHRLAREAEAVQDGK